jgi:hypothetical protein
MRIHALAGWFVVVAALTACGDDAGGEGSGGSSGPGSSDDGGATTASTSATSGSGSGMDSTVGSGSDGGSDDSTGGPGPSAPGCAPLPAPPSDAIALTPADDLAAAIASAPAGATLVLADGSYDVSAASYIVLATDGVTIRSQSGDPEAVIIDGGYGIGEVFSVVADDITIAELTIQRAINHPIHVTGGPDSDTVGTTIYRVRVIDPGQQGIKINAADGTYADFGTIACSHLELTEAGRTHVTDCYTGGIDAHLAQGWAVRDNTIVGFWCEAGLSEHGVHFWNSGRDTVVERNLIVDCARGVGFGLGESGNGTSRDYGEPLCPGISGFVGHYGGVIRNNMIVGRDPALFASAAGMDSGIALEQACDTHVAHNTIVSLQPPFVSMEYRWPNTRASIVDNLVTHTITMRDGGVAELDGNLEMVGIDGFVDPAGADLHLVAGAAAIDAAAVDPTTLDDFDGDARDASPDVGADEFTP